jgi:hypothetical protein
MNSKGRADLQRKLTLNAVPRPPAGLAERIKADIPKYLVAEAEPPRSSRNLGFSLRIAASFLIVITTLAVSVYLIAPGSQRKSVETAAVRQPGPFAPAPRALQDRAAPTVTGADEVHVEIAEQAPAAELPGVAATGNTTRDKEEREAEMLLAQDLAAARDDKKNEGRVYAPESDRASSEEVPSVAVAQAEPNAAGGAPRPTEGFAKSAPAPQPAPAVADAMTQSRAPSRNRMEAPAPATAPVAPPPPPVAAEAQINGPSVSLVPEARAAKMSFARKDVVFGISTSSAVFENIRATLARGDRPEPSAVNVDALVNYFAGTPPKRPKRGVRVEVEASPAPIESHGDHAVLRFTVDTADPNDTTGGSVPPVAANARVEVDINDTAVVRARKVGAPETPTTENALLYGTSVTALYDLELQPHLRSSDRIATVRLRYTDVTDGKEKTITREIFGRDLATTWERASRRHRLASLGALWAESLKAKQSGDPVIAEQAHTLSSQDPSDARAKDLANAVKATVDPGW